MNLFKTTISRLPYVPIAILFSTIYWLYLSLSTHMLLVYDAIGYLELGHLIHNKGWISYLQSPNREPLYPFFISIAISIGSWLDISALSVLKTLQFSVLLLTQFLLWTILKRLNIRNGICVAAILYLGFSPAIINAATSLYSEILTLPLSLGLVLLSSSLWRSIKNEATKMYGLVLLLSLDLILLTLVKGVFEFITPIFLSVFFIQSFQSFLRNKRKNLIHYLIPVLTCFFIYYGTIITYKYLNYRFNNNFTVSAQSKFGPWNLYGNAVRRSAPITSTDQMTALLAVPGEEFCEAVYGKNACYQWSLMKSDEIALKKLDKLKASGVSSPDNQGLFLSFKEILKNPLQYLFLTFLEASKTIFWESTHIGFVAYPNWISKIYDNSIIAFGLTIVIGILSLIGLLVALCRIIPALKTLSAPSFAKDETLIIFFSLLLILPFTGIHAILYIIKRYLFPLAPLYIILISISVEHLFNKFNNTRTRLSQKLVSK